MSSICWPCVKEKVLKHKIAVIIYLILCLAASAVYGYKSMGSAGVLSSEYLSQLEEYEHSVADYDASIADVEKSIVQQEETVASQQDYIDNSVYMKLSSDSIYMGSLQYTLSFDSGVNAGAAAAALLSYARDGGLVSDAYDFSGLDETKYWQEVISLQMNNNTNFVVNIMEYSQDKAQEAVDIIDKCIENFIPELKSSFGQITCDLMNESIVIKSDIAIINGQNSARNNLRSYLTTKADLESKLVNTKTSKDTYIDKNKPLPNISSPIMAFIKGVVIVMVLGVGALVALFWFILRFDNIVRGAADIESTGLAVLGKYRNKTGFDPEASRVAMDIELASRNSGCNGIYIADLGSEDGSTDVIVEMTKSLEAKKMNVENGYDPAFKTECLEKMVEAKQTVLIIRCGYTKAEKIKEFVEICKKYGISILGAIAVQ